MAGNASKTTQFFPSTMADVPDGIKEQFALFGQFAHANQIFAVPVLGTHDLKTVAGYTKQYYARFVNTDGEVFDASMNIQLESNSEDTDIREIRVHFGLPEQPVYSWMQWRNLITAAPADTVMPVGKQLPNGNYQMNCNVPSGTTITQQGVTYEAVQVDGMFGLQWKVVS